MQEQTEQIKQRKKEYLQGLNQQESYWADTCGIVRGYYGDGCRYGCVICGILVEMSNKELKEALGTEEDKTVKDPITEKGWVTTSEIIARKKFLALAAQNNCNHFEKRLGYANDKKAHDVFGLLALAKLLETKEE